MFSTPAAPPAPAEPADAPPAPALPPPSPKATPRNLIIILGVILLIAIALILFLVFKS